jgi:hypothetical protein
MHKTFYLVWWYTPVIPALRKLRQEDHKFKVSLGYIERPCLEKKRDSGQTEQ